MSEFFKLFGIIIFRVFLTSLHCYKQSFSFDWNDLAAIAQIFSTIFVAISLVWIAKNTKATEKMVQNQMLPAVDVNMIYDKNEKKTYFWFLNASAIPALVLMKLKIRENEQSIGPLRIVPYHPQVPNFKKTATAFDFLNGKEDEVVEALLKVEVNPANDNQKIKSSFTKNYRFNTSTKDWDEITWSFPDIPFVVSG